MSDDKKPHNPPAPKSTTEDQAKYAWPFGVDRKQFESLKTRKAFHVDYLTTHFRDFARSNLFKVEFNLSPEIQNKYDYISISNNEKTEFTAKTFNIPAYDMGKHEIKRMGQRIILPSTMNTGECQATFYCDDNYTQRKYLLSWFRTHVYDYDRNTYRKVASLHSSKITVYQLDNQFNIVMGFRLNHAWPTSIGEIQFSHDSENQITEFPATFAYSTYEILSPDADIKI